MQNDEIINRLIEVELPEPDSFLKIRETLGRIGIASKKSNILYPSCHILHKRGRYFIVTFFELFELEGKPNNMCDEDVARRNTIARLLEQWGLCTILNKHIMVSYANMTNIKIVPYKEKDKWEFRPKFRMVSDRRKQGENR
jgi:hypothetical protein